MQVVNYQVHEYMLTVLPYLLLLENLTKMRIACLIACIVQGYYDLNNTYFQKKIAI